MAKNKESNLSMGMGIASIALGLISPIIGVTCGIVGFCLEKNKKHYNRDIILNTIGVCVSILNFIFAIILMTI